MTKIGAKQDQRLRKINLKHLKQLNRTRNTEFSESGAATSPKRLEQNTEHAIQPVARCHVAPNASARMRHGDAARSRPSDLDRTVDARRARPIASRRGFLSLSCAATRTNLSRSFFIQRSDLIVFYI